MKAKWKAIGWTGLRTILMKLSTQALSKLTGPIGYVAMKVLPIFMDKLIKPGYQWTYRKAQKAINKFKGKKQAEDIRNESTDDIDAIYDELNK